MRYPPALIYIAVIAPTLLFTACGPSGTNSTDVFPNAAVEIKPTSGPDSFLIFPNPQKQDDGSLQTNTVAYATAYYEAIDPDNTKDTLAKWKAANEFGTGLNTGSTEMGVVFGDVKDLSYGRRMTARDKGDGTYAFMVENYLVAPAAHYTYSSLNLDAAVARDTRWHVSTNAIEFGPATCTASDPPGCDPTVKFAKFYTFHPITGERLLEANLDGRGNKAMPGICISCHGGRAYPLTPAIGSLTGKPLFPSIGSTASLKRGDADAHLQPFDVGSFDFSTVPGYTRADQEAKLKTINKMVLCTYPLETAPGGIEDTCRRNVIVNGEWSSTPAATLIKQAYGGNGMVNAVFADTYVPAGWAGQAGLYNKVIIPACRTCHILRGTSTMPDLNFDTFNHFSNYASKTKYHVFERGNMPLAKIVYERLWNSTAVETLATFLDSAQPQAVRDNNGAVLKPGRPVALPGPDRTLASPAYLSAANSLYATTYQWNVIASPTGTIALIGAKSETATLTGPDGNYVLELVAGNGTLVSDPVQLKITLAQVGSPALPIAPGAIRFADIKVILQDGLYGCTNCHAPGGGPPVSYTDIDRNGDGLTEIAHGKVDDHWFYSELRGRVNMVAPSDSLLLRKPMGDHHGGGLIFHTANATQAAQYNQIVLWIMFGAPY